MSSENAGQTVMPYLLVDGVDRLLGFVESVFGAEVSGRLARPDGTVMHAEFRIGGTLVMVGEPMGEFEATPGMLFVRVSDCDSVYQTALNAGAESVMEVTHMYHAGERYGGVRDASGNIWWISTTVESVPWPEQQRRIQALLHQGLGE